LGLVVSCRLQVLGATNYSHWEQSHQLRECLVSDAAATQEMLDFAKKRLHTFAHVGTTDRLNDSFEAAAAGLSLSLAGHAYGGGEVGAACCTGAVAVVLLPGCSRFLQRQLLVACCSPAHPSPTCLF
jgi:hypothetical protein